MGFMTPGDVPARLSMTASDSKCPVLVSFDDGFTSNHAMAKSILTHHGIKALFFVCPGLMDLPRDRQASAIAANVFSGKTNSVPKMMTWKQVEELLQMGHAVGGHGMSHTRLAGLDPSRLEDEIGGAQHRLTEFLAGPATWFAFPFGDIGSIDKEALSVIARHFRYCRSGVRGLNRSSTSPLKLLAEHVDLNAPFAYQRMALEGGLDGRYRVARNMFSSVMLDTAKQGADIGKARS
jgi:peptidoglycan/xylan/chitin deacetylase (PgdA/CDA1 family)